VDDVGPDDETDLLHRLAEAEEIHVVEAERVEEDSRGEVRPEDPSEHHGVVKSGAVLQGLGDEDADSTEEYVHLGGNPLDC
jgi:hypothetical protein